MLLTAAERLRFADYLRVQIKSGAAIAEQMEKWSGDAGPPSGVRDHLIQNEKRKIAASMIVLGDLESAESFEYGSDETAAGP